MTSRRRSQTALRTARFALAAVASSMLGACAALPDDASVVEQLESETGVTVTRLGHPIELYRETFLKDPAGRFAFLGPFETNQMGQRELFLWIAVPIEPVADSVPVVEMNGAAVCSRHSGKNCGLRRHQQVALQDPDSVERNVLLQGRRGCSWRGSARPRN